MRGRLLLLRLEGPQPLKVLHGEFGPVESASVMLPGRDKASSHLFTGTWNRLGLVCRILFTNVNSTYGIVSLVMGAFVTVDSAKHGPAH